MARLDIRVNGRTQFSRTVDDTVVAAVLAAAVDKPKRVVKRNFGGKTVAEFDPVTGRKRLVKKAAPEKASDESSTAQRPVAQA